MTNPGPSSQSTTNVIGVTSDNIGSVLTSQGLAAAFGGSNYNSANLTAAGQTVGKKAVITGDSITAGGNNGVALTSGTGNGTQIRFVATNHGILQGGPAFITGFSQDGFNGYFQNANVIDANTLTVTTDRPVMGVGTVSLSMYGSSATLSLVNPLRFNDRAFFNMANSALGGQIATVINVAGSGQSSDQIAARFDRDVLAQNPDIVGLLSIGRNDLNAAGYDFSLTRAKILEMVQKCIYRGIRVILGTVTPINTTETNIYKLNAWIRQIAETTPGVVLADYHAITVDFSSATGNWLAGYSYDNTHPNNQGARKMADGPTKSALQQCFGGTQKRLDVASINDDVYVIAQSTQVLRNPMLTGSGTIAGTVTGTAPQFTTITNGSTVTTAAAVTARSDGLGNDMVLTISGASAGTIDILSDSFDAKVSAGDVLRASCNLQASGLAAITSVSTFVEIVAGGITYNVDLMANNGNGGGNTDSFDWVLHSNQFTVPAGLTSIKMRHKFIFTANPTAVLKIGVLSVRKQS